VFSDQQFDMYVSMWEKCTGKIFLCIYGICVLVSSSYVQASVKKKSVAGVRGKKPVAADAEKEEPMEKELSVS